MDGWRSQVGERGCGTQPGTAAAAGCRRGVCSSGGAQALPACPRSLRPSASPLRACLTAAAHGRALRNPSPGRSSLPPPTLCPLPHLDRTWTSSLPHPPSLPPSQLLVPLSRTHLDEISPSLPPSHPTAASLHPPRAPARDLSGLGLVEKGQLRAQQRGEQLGAQPRGEARAEHGERRAAHARRQPRHARRQHEQRHRPLERVRVGRERDLV